MSMLQTAFASFAKTLDIPKIIREIMEHPRANEALTAMQEVRQQFADQKESLARIEARLDKMERELSHSAARPRNISSEINSGINTEKIYAR